jgi:hypothetical protein
MNVVIYAEGAGEGADSSDGLTGDASPGEWLHEDTWGAAHVLTRRVLMEERGLREGQIHFYEGLRADRRRARGADLLDAVRLRRLLAWNNNPELPQIEMMIVLVDEDGDAQRCNTLKQHIERVPPAGIHRIVAAARQEFEAWLVSDHALVAELFDGAQVATPDQLERGVVKEQLAGMIARKANGLALDTAAARSYPRAQRITLAARCDLERLRSESPSFARFCADLRAA